MALPTAEGTLTPQTSFLIKWLSDFLFSEVLDIYFLRWTPLDSASHSSPHPPSKSTQDKKMDGKLTAFSSSLDFILPVPAGNPASGQQRGPEIHRWGAHAVRRARGGRRGAGSAGSKDSLQQQDHQSEMTQILCPLGADERLGA